MKIREHLTDFYNYCIDNLILSLLIKNTFIAAIPVIGKDAVHHTGELIDIFFIPLIILAGVNDRISDGAFFSRFVEYLVSAGKERTVHVFLFQIFVHVPDRVGID